VGHFLPQKELDRNRIVLASFQPRIPEDESP
jgi:hypothetical protein